MSDINLLPQDLKKKEDKILSKKGDFNDSEIEFKEVEKIEKQKQGPNHMIFDSLSKWITPKSSSNIDTNKSPKENLNNKVEPREVNKSFDINSLEVKTEKEPRASTNNTIKEKKFLEKIVIDKKNEKQNGVAKEHLNIKKSNKKSSPKSLRSFFKNMFKKQKTNTTESKDVNLLPEKVDVPDKAKITMILISGLMISVAVVFIVYFGISIYRININNDIALLNDEIDEISSQSKEYDNLILEIEDLKSRVLKITELLSKHVYWTKFFEQLEKNTLPEVRFSSFAGTTDGNITLSASAPDYYTVSRQWLHLTKNTDFANDIIINTVFLSSSVADGNVPRVSFSLTLDLSDGIFYK